MLLGFHKGSWTVDKVVYKGFIKVNGRIRVCFLVFSEGFGVRVLMG